MTRAPAKINLWLQVVGRRPDGYHLLDSLVAFADLADTLEIAPADSLSLTIDGPQAGSLASESDNLVLKAARELASAVGIVPRAALHLTKNIPLAAGLGGGSADAAAALHKLSELWRAEIPEDRFMALCSRIGADVAMCLAGRPVIARGIGEKLEGAPVLPDCGLLLVNPGVPLPTRDVFARRQNALSTSVPVPSEATWPTLADLVPELKRRGNDLTEAAVALQPVVGEVLAILERLPGVRYAAMSGSGATCFALFDNTAGADTAAKLLPVQWWRHAGRIVPTAA